MPTRSVMLRSMTGSSSQERPLAGPAARDAATRLLQRIRRAHPTAGLLEAADLQWWWRSPRATDDVPQLFWFDDTGRPEAAVVATDWGDAVALDPLVMPDLPHDRVAHVIERGLAHAQGLGHTALDVVIDGADDTLRRRLEAHGFRVDVASPLRVVIASMPVEARPPIAPLAAGYRATDRRFTRAAPHHMAGRGGRDVEDRLRETSLYRDDLDLVVLDDAGEVAAYTLCWHDPVTRTGLIEPMRTEDRHQRRGLARHLLTTGLDRLAAAGAARVKICHAPDNATTRTFYRSAGFVPDKETLVMSRR